MLVSGEAGIGKTRLLREFAESLRADGRPVAWARPEAVARSGPYALVADLLDEIAVMLGKAGEEARQLAGALGAASTEPAARPIAARVRGMLGQLGTGLVLMLEDIHLTDELSQAVIAHLARSARDDDVLIVATYRVEDETTEAMTRLLDLLTRDRIATHVRLKPLDRSGTIEMVTAMWGAPPSDAELGAIERLSEGIPFFTEELAAARESGGHTIPESIARAVLTRVQQLSEDARTVARVASLTEGSIDPAVIADAAGFSNEIVPGLLLEAIRVGLLSDQQGRLAFRHALVREAIQESIVSLERAELHRKLATAMEKRYGASEDAPIANLARHWKEAGEKERAAELYLEAGRIAVDSGALDEARGLLAASQDLAPNHTLAIDALAAEGLLLLRLQRNDEAIEAFHGASARYLKAGDRQSAARALWRCATTKAGLGTLDTLPLFDEALAMASYDRDSVLYNKIGIQKGIALARIHRSATEARPLLVSGLERAELLGDEVLLGEAHEGLAWLAELEADIELAVLHGSLACRHAVSTQDIELIARSSAHQAVRLILVGKSKDALRHIEVAEQHTSAGLTGLYRQSLDNIRAWILWRLGRPSDAELVASRLEATRWAREFAGVSRVWAAALAGDNERLQSLISVMWAEIGGAATRDGWLKSPNDVPLGTAESYVVLAELLARLEGEDSNPALTRELALAVAANSEGTSGFGRLMDVELAARALMRANEFDQAGILISELERGSESYAVHKAAATELRGIHSLHEKHLSEARAKLGQAADLFGAAGNSSDCARALRMSAEAGLEAGDDQSDLVDLLKRARQIAFEAGALVEANRCEALLRSVGVRPRAGRPKGSKRAKDELSAREQEVVSLVAAGATNSEIAARLFLSERTVQDHISNAQRRLGVSGRTGLAAWAAKRHLV